MKSRWLLLFLLLSQPVFSGDGKGYAVNAFCGSNEDVVCVKNTSLVFSHDTLYRYTRLISKKDAHYSYWAAYCKNFSSPNQCMNQLKKDYDVFVSFLLIALDDPVLEKRIVDCHRTATLNSFVFTRKKQCLYR